MHVARLSSLLLVLSACGPGEQLVGSPPSVTLLAPEADGAYFAGDPVVFEAEVEDPDGEDDIAAIWWTVGDEIVVEGEAAALDSFGVSSGEVVLDAGEVTLSVVVQDLGGHEVRAAVDFVVGDGIGRPSLALTAPVDGDTVYAGQTLRVVASADSPRVRADRLRFAVEATDGGGTTEVGSGAVASDGTIEIDTVFLNPGEATLTVRAVDRKAGQVARDVSLMVRAATDADVDGDGWSEREGDCDDTEADVNPEAFEVENGRDDDCDGVRDDGTARGDDDGDGYCEASDGCASPNIQPNDCDDTDPYSHPGAHEVCGDEIDQDCDGDLDDADEARKVSWYVDADGDGFGDRTRSPVEDCGPRGDFTARRGGDCADGDPSIRPDAVERLNGEDDDCDDAVDEEPRWHDDDMDGFCEGEACVGRAVPGDCDDTRAAVSPDVEETCDDPADNDCDGEANERGAIGCTSWGRDGDGDGWVAEGDTVCQCIAVAPYTARATGDPDCDDADADVFPGQTGFFTAEAAGGGWDYDCNDRIDADPPEIEGLCGWFPGLGCQFQAGWEYPFPDCGEQGSWYASCGNAPGCALRGRQTLRMGCR